jgi:hypothetical protein
MVWDRYNAPFDTRYCAINIGNTHVLAWMHHTRLPESTGHDIARKAIPMPADLPSLRWVSTGAFWNEIGYGAFDDNISLSLESLDQVTVFGSNASECGDRPERTQDACHGRRNPTEDALPRRSTVPKDDKATDADGYENEPEEREVPRMETCNPSIVDDNVGLSCAMNLSLHQCQVVP